MDKKIQPLAVELGQLLLANKYLLAGAESCTGGWIAKAITDIAGSAQWFDRGFVTYSNQAKQDMLGVKTEILANYGAVSKETVIAMVEGVLTYSQAQLGFAVSGIAGPSGGSQSKPVGTVYIAWLKRKGDVNVEHYCFYGNRSLIRQQAVEKALIGLIEQIKK